MIRMIHKKQIIFSLYVRTQINNLYKMFSRYQYQINYFILKREQIESLIIKYFGIYYKRAFPIFIFLI